MSIYRVGGWVRDKLLGYEPKDNDYAVVGETPAEFEDRWSSDYHVAAIGKSFPVYLVVSVRDDFKGEYAFARRERKIGLGHNGFEVESNTRVTLEEDLFRRDLTCNAIAVSNNDIAFNMNGASLESMVIDPFGGVSDIKQGVLRHVSDHFVEDPLRVYRLARFAARYGWVIAPETYRLAASIPWDEILALSGERVWQETERALRGPNPRRFFEELARMKVLGLWHRELMQLINVPAGPPEHHAEGDAFTHTMMVLEEACNPGLGLKPDQQLAVRFAALCHDLGKGVTPSIEWPSHHDHDVLGVPVVEKFCERLRVPNTLRDCAVVACREHMRVHRFLEMRKGKMVDLIKAADRCQMRSEGLAVVSGCDGLGRLPRGLSEGARALGVAAVAARAERGQPIPPSLKGEHIGLHIRNKKGNAVRRALKEKGLL
jgi:tRNA nucleotidyltransferase (CCA-adding enzyme)